MRRLDSDESSVQRSNESVDKSEIRPRATSTVRPVKSFNGMFVVSGDEEPDALAKPVKQNAAIKQVINKGVVTTVAVQKEEKNMEQEMQEVSYEEWSKDQESDLSKGKLTASELVTELVGKSVATAENLLSMMKQRGEVSEYQVVPIGAPATMEFNPGRVRVLSDHAGNVVDVEVS